MTDPTRIARDYIDIWNLPDPAQRAERIAALWEVEATFADPMTRTRGHDGVAEMIGKVRAAYPGMHFDLAGPPDGFGDMVRFSWTMAAPGEPPVVRGTDIVTCRAGRIAAVCGFFDLVPSGIAA